MDIIGNEIHRLDRVVQILVDFTRPRDCIWKKWTCGRFWKRLRCWPRPMRRSTESNRRAICPTTRCRCEVDADLMKQAILNLVLNGVQAMTQGGTLTLDARRDEEDAVLTEVRDQGGGIPPEVQEKIFELYFTTKKDGSGIGLAQTYQIMQWHYGSVEFDSIVGEGTTFRLRLPLVELRSESFKGGRRPELASTNGIALGGRKR